MRYPDWAPEVLVSLHKRKSKSTNAEESLRRSDPEQLIPELLKSEKKIRDMSAKQLEGFRASLSISAFSLPEKEGAEILGKLITDERMKSAWATLDTKVKSQGDSKFISFWNACEQGVLGWRSSQKLSKTQQKDYFMKIKELASSLSIMMNEATEFHDYSIGDLISANTTKRLLRPLDTYPDDTEDKYEEDDEDKLERARLYLDGAVPTIHAALDDIAAKAAQFSKKKPLVLKPRSDNASVHYLARNLSQYFRTEYGIPLHGVVAATTEVILDKQGIDSDYVMKILRLQ